MKKRLLSLALALVMVLALFPAAALAAEGDTTTELPKLATPTNLEWGKRDFGNDPSVIEDIPGYVRWETTLHQRWFEVAYYNVEDEQTPVLTTGWDIGENAPMETAQSDWKFRDDANELDSGTYYFTVYAVGDGTNYANSETARSETWEFVKPEAHLNAPQTPVWTDGAHITLPEFGDSSFDSYEISFFYSATEAAATGTSQLQPVSGTWPGANETCGLDEDDLMKFGPGYYYARIRALSNDITQCLNSDWSPLSAAYDFNGVYNEVNDALGEIADDADAATIRQTVQGIENLKDALAADQGNEDGVAAKLDALETQAGVTKTVEVAEGFTDFAQEDVSFVGAALNDLAAEATEVKLTVAPLAEETELVIPTLYNDTVVTKFSMDVEGVADTTALKVPVRITLPVPSHINPAFLVILHYDAQGVPTAIGNPYIYEANGKHMVSFVVDHFSDFVMTETKPLTELNRSMFTVDTAAVTYTGRPITKTVTGRDGDKDLVLGTDYTVTYADNTNVGTAKITIAGKGEYTGTLEYTFTIKKQVTVPPQDVIAGSGRPIGGKPTAPETPIEPETPAVSASEKFGDVAKDSWYEAGVTFVTEKGLFQGVSEGVFAPNTNMTRAMLMTVLARLDGQETSGGATWYAKAMDWAKAQGISDGTLPENNVTREQLVAMLYRYAKPEKAESGLDKFADGESVSDWAKEAMEWAAANGIVTGKDGARLDPQGTATRAEVAAMIQRFVEKTGK